MENPTKVDREARRERMVAWAEMQLRLMPETLAGGRAVREISQDILDLYQEYDRLREAARALIEMLHVWVPHYDDQVPLWETAWLVDDDTLTTGGE